MSDELSKLAVHTRTLRPWTLSQCVQACAEGGVGGVSVCRDAVEPIGVAEAARVIKGSGLKVPAMVGGGFFPAVDAGDRQRAIDANRKYIDEAAELGAEMLVLTCGAVPGMPMAEGRRYVADAIGALLPQAVDRQVRLAIEPMHPMYAADQSCINRMRDVREICEQLRSRMVGIALDVYHVWWDPDLEAEIALAGREHRLFGLHLCDWCLEMRDLVNDRGLMGDGCIELAKICGWMRAAGFEGFVEVEVFSERYWAMDQHAYLGLITERYRGMAGARLGVTA